MEVSQLRAFLTVAEELHFGRAAARLHVAQPPLSRTIKLFERELDTRLFDRTTRSVSLTAPGEALLGPARDVMDAVRRANEAVKSASVGEVGLVRISFAGSSSHELVGNLARTIRSERPGIQLELSSQNFALALLKRLEHSETDIALGRWDAIPPEIDAKVVSPDSLVVAFARSHRLARSECVSFSEMAAESFVSLSLNQGSIITDRMQRLSGEHGYIANVVQVAPDTQTALALVGAEVGCHLTLASVARNSADPHVSFVPVIEPKSNSASNVDLRAAWRKSEDGTAFKTVLAAMLRISAEADTS